MHSVKKFFYIFQNVFKNRTSKTIRHSLNLKLKIFAPELPNSSITHFTFQSIKYRTEIVAPRTLKFILQLNISHREHEQQYKKRAATHTNQIDRGSGFAASLRVYAVKLACKRD